MIKRNDAVQQLRRPLEGIRVIECGIWILGCNNPERQYWPAFCDAIEQKQLENDPRFATTELREKNNAELLSLVDDILSTKTRVKWMQIFQMRGLLFAPIQEVREGIEDPQALANRYVVDYDHPLLGTIRILGFPVSFGANTAGTHAPAPGLGEHTVSVLSEFVYSSWEIERLRVENVIK